MAIQQIKNARYLVAKYVPDPARMEPRNIGVIVWAAGGVACKFSTSNEADFVDDSAIYERWVNYWRACCEKKTIAKSGGGEVSRRDSSFLSALRDTQQGNYLLHEGGYFLESIPAADRLDAANYLYSQLVVEPKRVHDGQDRDTLKDRCDAVLDAAGVTELNEFKPNYPISLMVEGINQEFRFDYAISNGKPLALIQRVNLRTQPSTTTAAFLFECARETKQTKPAMRFAMLDASDAANEELVESRRRMLTKFCDVIDLSNHGRAVDQLGALSETL